MDPKSKPNESSNKVRLNKYIADCGLASRRHADELISDGLVMVNGKKVFELGVKIDPASDRISVKGKPLKPLAQKVYVMFHKPRNVVTTMHDPEGRPTIGDFFDRLPVRVYPVGRLDWDTEGLILLTNDGDFSQSVTHPSKEITKTYFAKVSGQPTEEQLNKLRRGISIIGGKVQAKAVERIRRATPGQKSDQYDWIKIVITEGKNRQVRLMFEKIGFDVMKLQRVAIGRLRLGNLERGQYMELNLADIAKVFEPDPAIIPREERAKKFSRGGGQQTSSKRGPGAKTKPKKSSGPSKSGRPGSQRSQRPSYKRDS
jgi:23S rRNA pseudouridine2605 synthase